MADLAVSGEAAGHVVRVCCLLEVRLVAGHAGGAESGKNAACMARAAGQGNVRARERKRCLGMVKRGPQPVRGAVAYGAVGREPGTHVIRIRGLLERRKVAGGTLHGRPGKLAADVTLRALHGGVRASQRESR